MYQRRVQLLCRTFCTVLRHWAHMLEHHRLPLLFSRSSMHLLCRISSSQWRLPVVWSATHALPCSTCSLNAFTLCHHSSACTAWVRKSHALNVCVACTSGSMVMMHVGEFEQRPFVYALSLQLCIAIMMACLLLITSSWHVTLYHIVFCGLQGMCT